MLGNFSVGDYFKQGAAEFAWELSTEGFGFDPERIWITVFGGDEELGARARRGGDRVLARDRRARRADRPARPRGQLLAVRARPGRAGRARSSTSTAGPTSAPRTTGRATTPSASSSSGTSCSCSTSCTTDGSLTELPQQNIDTGMGARPHGGDPPGRAVGLRDRRLPAADRARRGAARAAPTARTRRPPARCACWPTTAARPRS